jgi:hypothetical protein
MGIDIGMLLGFEVVNELWGFIALEVLGTLRIRVTGVAIILRVIVV